MPPENRANIKQPQVKYQMNTYRYKSKPLRAIIFITFRFDNRPGVWYKTRNCLSTGLVPRSRSARLKGKRVQVPRCPATVRGDRRRNMPLGKPGKARRRNDPRARKPAIPMLLGPPWNEGPKPDNIFIPVFSSPCPLDYSAGAFLFQEFVRK